MPTPENGYRARKAYYNRMVTVYGRKPVLEILQDSSLDCRHLHLAESNRPVDMIQRIVDLATSRRVEVKYHSRQALSRISRNGRQDQGVALDVFCPKFRELDHYLQLPVEAPRRLLALDGITNPQNLGMILRSSAAGAINGVIWSNRGNAALGPLVIKASVGTLFRAPLLICEQLTQALIRCREAGFQLCALDASGTTSLFELEDRRDRVFVLGNESEGVSPGVTQLCQQKLHIPMNPGVESLNVAVTAGLIAYLPQLGDQRVR